uniref:Uncharacterized protein n=1 Tax=Sphaerodactylus townsendi TaxID=933632 RepID=A0ACB8EAL2_9SAUR
MAFRALDKPSQTHYCGGSLINQNCGLSHITWVLGEYDPNSNAEPVQIKTIAKLNSRVSPVCLASATRGSCPKAAEDVLTTGWGRTSTNTNSPAVKLQQVASAPLVTGQPITSNIGGNVVTSSMGDSGGPLVCLKGSIWNLIGIVSWGTSNCNVQTPAAYTRVSKFRSWIDQVVARN